MTKPVPEVIVNRPASEWTVSLNSVAATESLGRCIGEAMTGGEVMAVIGELGAGKTALVRGVSAAMGVLPSSVTSPTFVLVHEYRGRLPLVHIDLYRLRTLAELQGIGWEEYFSRTSVVAIEWADRFPAALPPDHLEIRLVHQTPATRTAAVTPWGPQAQRLLDRVRGLWEQRGRLRERRKIRQS